MTTEEMKKRWPEVPPFEAKSVMFDSYEQTEFGVTGKEIIFLLDAEGIDEAIAYLQAVKESMNA